MIDEYVNGFVERKQGGKYEGSLTIEGIRLPSISAVYFKDGEENYLWLRRKKVLDYDFESQTYKEREAKPQFEAYLKKQLEGDTVAYKVIDTHPLESQLPSRTLLHDLGR